MFEVKVTVEIPGLPEAINALANALSKSPAAVQAASVQSTPASEVVAAPVASPAPVASATPYPVASPAPVASATPYPAANPTTPAPVAPATTAPTGPAQTSCLSDAKPITLDDIGRAGAALIDAGKMPQLISAAQLTVLELQQTFVDDWKAANADGKLSQDEITRLVNMLIEKTMEKMSNSAIKLLTAAGVDITAIIKGAGEAMIQNMKR